MKLDMHIHSIYSRDGTAAPKDILKFSKKVGMDGLAIADHNAIDGSREAFSMGVSEGLLVVRAVEVSAAEGHVVAYGVKDLVPKGLPVTETIEKIHELGGVAVAAHPKRFPSGVGLDVARDAKFDAIEALNGGSSRRNNSAAEKLAKLMKMPVVGGSDAHELEQVGKCYTVVDGASSEDDVLEAILKGRTSLGGRSPSASEGVRYSIETFIEWLKGDLRRL